MSPFILAWRDREVWLIGPFDNQVTLLNWIDKNNRKDDPRWQAVNLPIARTANQYTIRVDRPEMGPLP